MSRIVAGRFDRSLEADAAIADLKREGFSPEEYDSFYVTPPGQHQMLGIGGDVHSDAGTRGGARRALLGALLGAVVGIVLGFFVAGTERFGPLAMLLLAGLGAYIGSFAGALSKFHGGRRREATVEHPVEPKGGRMIAVCVDRPSAEPAALAVLQKHGARNVGRAEGEWRDGGWRDFDPRAPLTPA